MSCLGERTLRAFHLVAEEPNIELENGRLLAIDLDFPGDGKRLLEHQTFRRTTVALLRRSWWHPLLALTIEKPWLPITLRLYKTRTYTGTHCSWICCWKLGRLRSLRARRRIFFSSSVSFFCPISFNLAAASHQNRKTAKHGLVGGAARFGGTLVTKTKQQPNN